MKYLFIALVALSSFCSFAQEVATDKEVLSLLSSVGTEKNIVLKNVRSNISLAYKSLDRVVDYVASHPSDKTITEVLRVAIYAASLDPSHASGEILLDLYTKNKAQVEKLLKTFPSKQSNLLKTHLRAAQSELEKGNG